MACSQTNGFIKMLKCSNCQEIPWTEVFQCLNAHLICDKCYSKLIKCPECSIDLDQNKKIQSAIENILNSLEFNCPRKEQGCEEKLARNMVSNHIEQKCIYRNIKLCKRIGFQCDFLISPANISEAVQHFQKEHGASFQDSRSFTICLKDVTSKNDFTSVRNCVWSPVIVQLENTSGVFLIFGKTAGKSETMEMKFWFLGNSSSIKNPWSNFQICLDPASESKLTWKAFPTGIWDHVNLFREKSFTVPLQLLNNKVPDDGKILINVAISKPGETIEFQEGEKYTIETNIHRIQQGAKITNSPKAIASFTADGGSKIYLCSCSNHRFPSRSSRSRHIKNKNKKKLGTVHHAII